jgi:hypothetical protein
MADYHYAKYADNKGRLVGTIEKEEDYLANETFYVWYPTPTDPSPICRFTSRHEAELHVAAIIELRK